MSFLILDGVDPILAGKVYRLKPVIRCNEDCREGVTMLWTELGGH